ncbi:hypothetical protein [Micromonospora sp. 4G55]|uniref:hypothetical protein n=1 Tax=Micromonospora sp. 4G55 TaxID=2806102 RepID=UPI001A5B391D|nr:hypothetical protein [Micromonospora sp. 4G55]MBM0256055.1 hypothetical protein [Micromonospora sp. 4G55]
MGEAAQPHGVVAVDEELVELDDTLTRGEGGPQELEVLGDLLPAGAVSRPGRLSSPGTYQSTSSANTSATRSGSPAPSSSKKLPTVVRTVASWAVWCDIATSE